MLFEPSIPIFEFIGLEKVKDQVARLKSAVAMELVRKQRGLEVAQRTHHLVFTGPPGTGKTTIARVVAKIYCGLGLLKRENIKEVHRADLIGQHIGETEAKTNAIIDSALDGVLFLDEAYALVATGAKNDFGLVAIDTLLARMENDRDRLVVIIAGYRADLDRFLDTNQGLRSRFTRSIDFPSYKAPELIEIANFMAAKRDSVFEQAALDTLEALFAQLADSSKPDAAGVERRGLDIAGNGRFVRNVVEKSEEEREFRLDHSEHAETGEFTDEELMTITAEDVSNSVEPLLQGLGPAGAGMTNTEPDGEWAEERRSFSSRTPVNDNPDQVVYRRGFVTRHQVTGWRFVMRRIASGIALHDTRMLVDPLRTQSRAVLMGALILITGLAGCFVFSLIRPSGAAGNNAVLADRSTAALYVRVGDELHPVLNLTSARLIVGQPVNPTTVKSTELDRFPRGNLIGIPGAPERMVQNTSHDANWTVCDAVSGPAQGGHAAHSTGVTVIAGPPDSRGARAGALGSAQGVLVDY